MHGVWKSGIACAAVVGAVLVSGLAMGGPIVPPAGPVKPTGPVLIIPQGLSLPFTINQPGVYRLMGDINAGSGSDAILVRASDVTIDLNGFCLRATPDGVSDAVSPGLINGQLREYRNVTVCNGTLVGWRAGITPLTQDAQNPGTTAGVFLEMRAEDLVVRDCTSVGIGLGLGATLERCRLIDNGVNVVGSDQSVIRDCILVGGNQQSMTLTTNATVTGCVFSGGDSGTTFGVLGQTIGGSGRNLITDNVFRGFATGVFFTASNPGQLVYRNVFFDCTTPVSAASSDQPVQPNSVSAGPFTNIAQ